MDIGTVETISLAARPRRRRWFGTCLWLHRWTGLVALPFFLILCLTGSILIFRDEIDVLLGAMPQSVDGGDPLPLATLASTAVATHPGLTPSLISIDPDRPDRAFVRLAEPGKTDLDDTKLAIVSRFTGQPLIFTQPDSSLTGVLLDLHAKWFLKTPGQLFGAGIAVMVLVCLVTGVVVHAPFVRRLVFGTVRRGRGARIVQLDLHNVIGLVVLGWAALVTISGIMLAADVVLLPIWRNTELREMMGKNVAPAAAPISIDQAVAAAQGAVPDRTFHFAFYPGTDYSSPRHYTVALYGTHRYDEQLFTFVAVDAETGQVADARPVPWYLKAVLFSGPLHFGNYGGIVLKLLWLANSWGALFITGNGAWLWWRRRARLRT